MTHLPTGYNPSIQYPLVLCFHGGQNGAQSSQLGWQAIAFMSKLSQKADSAGFIVVYPEGTVINNNRTWNAGGCCQPATTNNIDDVGFVSLLIDTLIHNYPVDSVRVYASGSSNGALLCYRLACEIPHKIAAIASVSGTQEFFPCNPSQKMPVINFHSKADIAVPYNGGVGEGPSGTYFTSQDSSMQIWTALNNCLERDTVFNGGDSNYTYIRIHNCSCNVEYHHYATSDGGHSWPGGNPNKPNNDQNPNRNRNQNNPNRTNQNRNQNPNRNPNNPNPNRNQNNPNRNPNNPNRNQNKSKPDKDKPLD
jgi:polyhydroxybutyrate depolymerase